METKIDFNKVNIQNCDLQIVAAEPVRGSSALMKDKVVEVWEINTAIEGTGENAGKYESCYYNGYITEFELTANAEDFTEYSLTVGVFGEPKDGYATLTQEQLEADQYVFKDTVFQTAA